ncbi:hypothetical protein FOZ60_006209 [Perkinsus olseni]|uniref:Uncharacterized protein n=1 Tax=Perkinsus olseni TaxID=32597 RepID=A0A7J6NRQ9_PEROL|nr:hypothetical protein FOZ60_006209 [Perkinsus olseni]
MDQRSVGNASVTCFSVLSREHAGGSVINCMSSGHPQAVSKILPAMKLIGTLLGFGGSEIARLNCLSAVRLLTLGNPELFRRPSALKLRARRRKQNGRLRRVRSLSIFRTLQAVNKYAIFVLCFLELEDPLAVERSQSRTAQAYYSIYIFHAIGGCKLHLKLVYFMHLSKTARRERPNIPCIAPVSPTDCVRGALT